MVLDFILDFITQTKGMCKAAVSTWTSHLILMEQSVSWIHRTLSIVSLRPPAVKRTTTLLPVEQISKVREATEVLLIVLVPFQKFHSAPYQRRTRLSVKTRWVNCSSSKFLCWQLPKNKWQLCVPHCKLSVIRQPMLQLRNAVDCNWKIVTLIQVVLLPLSANGWVDICLPTKGEVYHIV